MATVGAAYAAQGPQASCAAMQHKCCKALKIAGCCRISQAPATASTPAESRFTVVPMTAAAAAAPALLLLAPMTHASAAVRGGSPPERPPADFVTLYSALLI